MYYCNSTYSISYYNNIIPLDIYIIIIIIKNLIINIDNNIVTCSLLLIFVYTILFNFVKHKQN